MFSFYYTIIFTIWDVDMKVMTTRKDETSNFECRQQRIATIMKPFMYEERERVIIWMLYEVLSADNYIYLLLLYSILFYHPLWLNHCMYVKFLPIIFLDIIINSSNSNSICNPFQNLFPIEFLLLWLNYFISSLCSNINWNIACSCTVIWTSIK